jgi:hypothetical protein
LRVLKLEGLNLKVKLKLKCLKGVPEGGVVFDRFPKVRDRRFRTEGCSGGLQRVFGLVKERLRGCSGGLQRVFGPAKSYLEGIALGIEKRLRMRFEVKDGLR